VRHQVVALATFALVLALGVAFEAPLRELANPNLTPEPAKAPWYFVGIQELLAHFDPTVAGVFAPVVLVGALVVLPYVDRSPARAPERRRVARALFLLVAGALLILTLLGAFFRGPGWVFVLPWEHWYFEP
jgi:menaquinol-cytochrome c reductase cytochrome b/c subunit